MYRPRRLLLAISVIVGLTSIARAEDPLHLVTFVTDEHRWNLQLFATALTDVSGRDVCMGGPTVGIGYYVLDNLAINAEFSGFFVDQDTGSAAAGAASLGLRHHILDLGRSSLFVDVAGGFFTADAEVPAGGTHSNTTFQVGLGIAYPLKKNVYIVGGARYFHLSNADREGDDENPSINAVQGFLGLMFRF